MSTSLLSPTDTTAASRFAPVTLMYDEVLIRKAVRAFWWRTLGMGFFAAWCLTAAMLLVLLMGGDRSWFVGVLAALALFVAFIALAGYRTHYRDRIEVLRKMSDGRAQLHVQDETVTFSSRNSSSTFPWSTITKIWRFDDFWLLFYGRAFSILPIAQIGEPMRAFILKRVTEAGGKLR